VEITYREALNQAIVEEMEKDDKIYIIGEEIGKTLGGSFFVTKGLEEKFGSERVRSTPISEVAIIGTAIGSAATGLRPIAEIMFNDFIFVAADQIVNQMAKLRYMTGGQIKLPITVRMAMGSASKSQAAHHAQCVMGMFMNVPGLKIVCPSNPYDAKGILKSAIRDNNPVLVFEHIALYNEKGEVPDEDYCIPIGKAEIKREGKDVTIIAISNMVNKSLKAAGKMEERGIDIEVIDPVSLVPLDNETIINSVKKTGKVIIASNGPISSGPGTEILARINDFAFEYLDAPIIRIGDKDSPIPFSQVLESYIMPQEEDIIKAIERLVN
jgi:acetoin:2,6-dichlorophenolindophenol oxidoreductase subunit beta